MNYSITLKNLIQTFESEIHRFFMSKSIAQTMINDSMLYSLKAGGKRIRPLLLIEMCKTYGGTYEDAIEFAMALEMIHTYSLIHDDLPCMDNDDLRRGKPTNHIEFGYDMAVLAGDGLLNKASEIMVQKIINTSYEPRYIHAMSEILTASGTEGMILGQVADIKYQSDEMTVEMLDFINHHKTGKLLIASMKAGAIIGGASPSEINKIEQIASKVGLLFQVVDDMLDIIGDVEKLGKRTQMDLINEKITYPMLLGIDETQKRIKQLEADILDGIKALSCSSTFLKETIHFLVNREF